MQNQESIQKIKSVFSISTVRNLAIVSLIAFVADLIAAFSDNSILDYMLKMASEMARLADLPYELIDTFAVLIKIDFIALAGVVGWILIFAMSKSSNTTSTPSAGFTIFNILALLGLVSSLLITVFGIISVVDGGKMSSGRLSSFGFGMSFLGGIIAIIGIFLALAQYYRFRFFNSAKKSLGSPSLVKSGTGWGVMCIITAVFIFISVLIKFIVGTNISRSGMNQSTTFSIIATVFSGIAYCMQAKIVFKYNKAATMPTDPPYNGYNAQQTVPQNNGYQNNINKAAVNTAPPQNSYPNSNVYTSAAGNTMAFTPYTAKAKLFLSDPKRLIYSYCCFMFLLVIIGLLGDFGSVYWRVIFCMFI